MSSNEFRLNELPKKTVQHRRIGSFPSLDNLVTRGKQIFNLPNESSTVSTTLREESSKVRFISSTTLNEDPINTDETLNSSLSRRNDHRRNLSDPMTSASLEDLSTPQQRPNDRLSLDETQIEHEKHKMISNSTPQSKKKKPWYKSFQSTYEERSHEFRKFFRDLPSDDRLVADYSCAWQRDILVHGRIYLSTSSLCFYSNILLIKANFTLKWKEIGQITREKTVKVIPNAIEIKTHDSTKYFFTTFNSRDKTFQVIEDLWTASKTDQSISSERLTAILHDNYGNDCDLDIDEEIEEIHLPPTNETNETNEIENLSPQTNGSNDEQTPTPEMIPHEEQIVFLSRCPCDEHCRNEIFNQNFSLSVDRLFDFIFGDNDRLKAYRIARRISDYQTNGWHFNSEQNRRERLCTYKVTVSAVIGTMVMTTNEKQIVNSQTPKSHYIVTTEIRNEGAKYTDSFYVLTRYCFTQINSIETNLRVTSEVKYIKSVISFAKSKSLSCPGLFFYIPTLVILLSLTMITPFSFVVFSLKNSNASSFSSSSLTKEKRKKNTNGRSFLDGAMFFKESFDTEREKKKNEKMSQLGRDETIEKTRKDILSTVFIMNKWKFRKSLSRFIKCHILCARSAFIEKNTNAALQESFNDLMKRITEESRTIETNSNDEQNANRTQSSTPASVILRERIVTSTSPDGSSSGTRVELPSTSTSIIEQRRGEDQTRQNLLPTSSSPSSTTIEPSQNYYRQILIIISILLLFVNIYLCSKLNQIDRMTNRLLQSYPPWLNDHSYESDQNQWSILLQRQEEYYQSQLSGLQSVLISTHNALRNVTETLNRLSKFSSGST